MQMKTYKTIILLIIITGLYSCYNPSKISTSNISSSYSAQSKTLGFVNYPFLKNDSTLCIYFSLNTGGLLYKKNNLQNYFTADFKLFYELYAASNHKHLLDSLSIKYSDTVAVPGSKVISDSFLIHLPVRDKYTLFFRIHDLNRNYILQGFSYFDNSSIYSPNHFLLKDENNRILIKNYFNKGEKFRIISNVSNTDKIFVLYYKIDFPQAEPPFSVSPENIIKLEEPDSISLVLMQEGSTDYISTVQKGVYIIKSDTSRNEGLCLFHFYQGYPSVTTPLQMTKPLQYITTKKEFMEISQSKNLKTAIDQFWLDISGNPERASEMIKMYYNRVQNANLFFTTYKEGWKTDRGMMYVVMGPPETVYRSPSTETWYYSDGKSFTSIIIDFNKSENPVSGYDFTLQRSLELKSTWFNAVENLRR